MSKPRIYKLLFTATFVLISYAIINIADKPSQHIEKETLGQQVTQIISVTVIPTNVPSIAVSSPSTFPMTPPGVQAKVNRVIDGDTIEVILSGQKKKVRLIGINTPETVDPRKPVQCFGKEASAYAKQLLSNKTVYLESDPTQGDFDKYHRSLRYVWLDAKANANEIIIAEGYAYEYTYNIPYKYQSEFRNAQKEAEDTGRGLWSPNSCGGK